MGAARPAEILRHLEHAGAADAELLARFLATRDGAAFAELVRRHGALVLGVCRRVTGHPEDAEDAFQATFLVLARKAASVRAGAPLATYLYGVAFRVAQRAKRAVLRRRAREVTVPVLPDPAAPEPAPAWPGLAPILDEELAALTARHRDAIVLCDLQGKSREAAAAALGVPEGTLSSRLANGRKRLAARLTRRGISLSVAALPVALAEAPGAMGVPTELLTKTCGLVTEFAAGGPVPRPLARLSEGGFLVRKTLAFGLVMVAAVAGAVFAARPDAAPPADPPQQPLAAARKAEPAPQPNLVPKPDDNPRFTTAPKRRRSLDLPVTEIGAPLWNATGTHLAVHGFDPREQGTAKQRYAVVWLLGVAAD